MSAGLDSEGKEIYIGRGVVNSFVTPGRLLIEDDGEKKAGVYVELSLEEHLITTKIEYYARNSICNYKWVPSSNGEIVTNAVETQAVSESIIYYVGRVSANGSLHVGKVLVSQQMYYGSNGKAYEAASYEVLICERKILMKFHENHLKSLLQDNQRHGNLSTKRKTPKLMDCQLD